MKNVTIQNRRF